MVEGFVIDGHDAHLHRAQAAVEVDAERDALDLGGFGQQGLDIPAQVFEAAFIVNGGDIVAQLSETLGLDGILGQGAVQVGDAVDVDLQLMQTVDQLPEGGDRVVVEGSAE